MTSNLNQIGFKIVPIATLCKELQGEFTEQRVELGQDTEYASTNILSILNHYDPSVSHPLPQQIRKELQKESWLMDMLKYITMVSAITKHLKRQNRPFEDIAVLMESCSTRLVNKNDLVDYFHSQQISYNDAYGLEVNKTYLFESFLTAIAYWVYNHHVFKVISLTVEDGCLMVWGKFNVN
jgi:hypothetical protein